MRWWKRSASTSRPRSRTIVGQVAERLLERGGLGVGVDEHERSPGADRHRHQPEPGAVEVRVGARRGAQAAVEPVGPGVVRALQRAALGRAGRDERAAVAADVGERAQDVVAVAREHDREAGDVGRGEAARRGQLVAPAGVLPRAAEDRRALALRDLAGPRRRTRAACAARSAAAPPRRAHPPRPARSRASSGARRHARRRPSYASSSVVTRKRSRSQVIVLRTSTRVRQSPRASSTPTSQRGLGRERVALDEPEADDVALRQLGRAARQQRAAVDPGEPRLGGAGGEVARDGAAGRPARERLLARLRRALGRHRTRAAPRRRAPRAAPAARPARRAPSA